MNMKHIELTQFQELFDKLSEYYQKPRISSMALEIYLDALSDYSLEQIKQAARAHARDPKAGKFYPKAADLIAIMSGPDLSDLSADDLVAAARNKNTPLGILARIHIGSWDLNNQDAFYLRQRATECLQLLPKWASRAERGNYSDHEISIMVKHGVDPTAGFHQGAVLINTQALATRIAKVKQTERHQFLLEDHA